MMEGFGAALTLPTSTSLVIMTMLKQFSCHTILQKSYSVSSIGPAGRGGKQESKNIKAMCCCEMVHSSDLPHTVECISPKTPHLIKLARMLHSRKTTAETEDEALQKCVGVKEKKTQKPLLMLVWEGVGRC